MKLSPSINRHRMASLAMAGWLMVLTAIVVVDHKHDRSPASPTRSPVDVSIVRSLETRLSAVETQLAMQKGPQPSVGVERFDNQIHAVDERLTQLEQRPQESVSSALDALANRVSLLETSRARSNHAGTVAGQPKERTGVSSDPAEPPFRILGLERRGGETFLAISPPHAVSLAEMSVLRIGDIQGGWQLDALDSHSATFQFQGQVRHLSLP